MTAARVSLSKHVCVRLRRPQPRGQPQLCSGRAGQGVSQAPRPLVARVLLLLLVIHALHVPADLPFDGETLEDEDSCRCSVMGRHVQTRPPLRSEHLTYWGDCEPGLGGCYVWLLGTLQSASSCHGHPALTSLPASGREQSNLELMVSPSRGLSVGMRTRPFPDFALCLPQTVLLALRPLDGLCGCQMRRRPVPIAHLFTVPHHPALPSPPIFDGLYT